MYILGISCYYHDAAAALIQEGKLIAAAAEERIGEGPPPEADRMPGR